MGRSGSQTTAPTAGTLPSILVPNPPSHLPSQSTSPAHKHRQTGRSSTGGAVAASKAPKAPSDAECGPGLPHINATRRPAPPASGAGTNRTAADRALERIIQLVEGRVTMKRVRDVFRSLDNDGNGEIDAQEMSAGMMALGVQLSNEEVAGIVGWLDTNNNGLVSFEELDREMMQRLTARRQLRRKEEEKSAPPPLDAAAPATAVRSMPAAADRALQQIVRLVEGRVTMKRVRDIFRSLDNDGNGEIDVQEMRAGMTGLGVQLSDEEVTGIVDWLDADGNGLVSYEELDKEMVRRLTARRRLRRKKEKKKTPTARRPPGNPVDHQGPRKAGPETEVDSSVRELQAGLQEFETRLRRAKPPPPRGYWDKKVVGTAARGRGRLHFESLAGGFRSSGGGAYSGKGKGAVTDPVPQTPPR
jgi:Ca2+-binding EF-hand superfamily protein